MLKYLYPFILIITLVSSTKPTNQAEYELEYDSKADRVNIKALCRFGETKLKDMTPCLTFSTTQCKLERKMGTLEFEEHFLEGVKVCTNNELVELPLFKTNQVSFSDVKEVTNFEDLLLKKRSEKLAAYINFSYQNSGSLTINTANDQGPNPYIQLQKLQNSLEYGGMIIIKSVLGVLETKDAQKKRVRRGATSVRNVPRLTISTSNRIMVPHTALTSDMLQAVQDNQDVPCHKSLAEIAVLVKGKEHILKIFPPKGKEKCENRLLITGEEDIVELGLPFLNSYEVRVSQEVLKIYEKRDESEDKNKDEKKSDSEITEEASSSEDEEASSSLDEEDKTTKSSSSRSGVYTKPDEVHEEVTDEKAETSQTAEESQDIEMEIPGTPKRVDKKVQKKKAKQAEAQLKAQLKQKKADAKAFQKQLDQTKKKYKMQQEAEEKAEKLRKKQEKQEAKDKLRATDEKKKTGKKRGGFFSLNPFIKK